MRGKAFCIPTPKRILPLLIVVGLLSVFAAQSYGLVAGDIVVGDAWGASDDFHLGNSVSFTVPSGYKVRITAIYAYLINTSDNGVFAGAIYDQDYRLVGHGDAVTVLNAYAWYKSICNIELMNGTYWLVGYVSKGTWYYSNEVDYDGIYQIGVPMFPTNLTISVNEGQSTSLYCEYSVEDLVTQVNYVPLVVMLVFVMLDLAVMLAGGWIPCLLFGLVSLVIGAASFSYSVPFSPYPQVVLIVLGAIALVDAARMRI